MTEKQEIELATAILFLKLYNSRFNTSFEIVKHGDYPDIDCIDKSSGDDLELEISLLEDLPGDVQYTLGRGLKPKSPTTGLSVVSFLDDSLLQLKKSIKKKLLSKYGPNTALILRQVSILWEPKDWELIADEFQNSILAGSETNFGKGVWIICTDNNTWPASDTLFCLYDASHNDPEMRKSEHE